jgi:hypothetical protein
VEDRAVALLRAAVAVRVVAAVAVVRAAAVVARVVAGGAPTQLRLSRLHDGPTERFV